MRTLTYLAVLVGRVNETISAEVHTEQETLTLGICAGVPKTTLTFGDLSQDSQDAHTVILVVKTEHSSPPYPGDMSQEPLWMPETTNTTEPYTE